MDFATDEVFEQPAHNTQYESFCVPCKVLAVCKDKKSGVRLLVHGCNFRKRLHQFEEDSVLIEPWELAYHDVAKFLPRSHRGKNYQGNREGDKKYWAPQLSWVRPENIVTRCLVVEEEPGVFENAPKGHDGQRNDRVLLIRKRDRWPVEFCDEHFATGA